MIYEKNGSIRIEGYAEQKQGRKWSVDFTFFSQIICNQKYKIPS